MDQNIQVLAEEAVCIAAIEMKVCQIPWKEKQKDIQQFWKQNQRLGDRSSGHTMDFVF